MGERAAVTGSTGVKAVAHGRRLSGTRAYSFRTTRILHNRVGLGLLEVRAEVEYEGKRSRVSVPATWTGTGVRPIRAHAKLT